MIPGLPANAVIVIADMENVLEAQICCKLKAAGYTNLISLRSLPLDLSDITQIRQFFEEHLPDCVVAVNRVHADETAVAGTPASQLHRNLNSLLNLIYVSYLYEVRKLINVVCNVGAAPFTPSAAPGSGMTAGELLCNVTSNLCDRYRREYDCDFISAYFQLSTTFWQIPEDHPGLNRVIDDPAETCLFLMGEVSSPGVFSFRGHMPGWVA